MKHVPYFVLVIALVTGCSSPKYTYKFDYYDYNSGKKARAESLEKFSPRSEVQPVLSASSSSNGVEVVEPAKATRIQPSTQVVQKKYTDMTRSEKKAFRQDVKAEIKNYKKALKKGEMTDAPSSIHAMDNDLKLAIIFGAVGLTLTLFGGINEAFWVLGVISIVVGVVFLIKWLVRQ